MEKKLIWENSFSVFNHLQAKANVKQQGKRFRTLSGSTCHQRTRKDKMKIVVGYLDEEKELRKKLHCQRTHIDSDINSFLSKPSSP